jgi:cytoskeletal protein CcmA (bactofilin family)
VTAGTVTAGTVTAGTVNITDGTNSSSINPQAASFAGNVNVGNTLNVTGNLGVVGNLDVGGNLNLKGKPIAQNMETLLVKDNIIVTNSSGAGFSLSGIVMRTSRPDENNPSAPIEAYGILYSPDDTAVMIGRGTLTEISNVTTGAVTYEFEFAEDEALPLAARSEFNNIKDGYIPVWDAEKNAFVPSGSRISENGNFEGDINVNGNVTGSEASFSKVEIHDGLNGSTIAPDFASFNEIRAKKLVINGVDAATKTWVEDYVAEYVANNGGGGDTADIAERLFKINTGGVEENG